MLSIERNVQAGAMGTHQTQLDAVWKHEKLVFSFKIWSPQQS
jgi:hypothetical protein